MTDNEHPSWFTFAVMQSELLGHSLGLLNRFAILGLALAPSQCELQVRHMRPADRSKPIVTKMPATDPRAPLVARGQAEEAYPSCGRLGRLDWPDFASRWVTCRKRLRRPAANATTTPAGKRVLNIGQSCHWPTFWPFVGDGRLQSRPGVASRQAKCSLSGIARSIYTINIVKTT